MSAVLRQYRALEGRRAAFTADTSRDCGHWLASGGSLHTEKGNRHRSQKKRWGREPHTACGVFKWWRSETPKKMHGPFLNRPVRGKVGWRDWQLNARNLSWVWKRWSHYIYPHRMTREETTTFTVAQTVEADSGTQAPRMRWRIGALAATHRRHSNETPRELTSNVTAGARTAWKPAQLTEAFTVVTVWHHELGILDKSVWSACNGIHWA